MPNGKPVLPLPYSYMENFHKSRIKSLAHQIEQDDLESVKSTEDIEDYCQQREAKRSVTPSIKPNRLGQMIGQTLTVAVRKELEKQEKSYQQTRETDPRIT